MALQQQLNQSETKVPFFCEWIFENSASGKYVYEKEGLSIFNVMLKPEYAEGDDFDYLSTPYYYLPGFPGIKYYLDLSLDDEDVDDIVLSLDFNVQMDYKNFDIDADYKCTITGYEPLHIVENLNHIENKNFSCTRIYECSTQNNECMERNCPFCVVKKVVIRVEGTFTVKHVGALPIEINVTEEQKLLCNKDDEKDFVIIVEEKEIRVHKLILIQNSTVFATMFESNNWKETMENKMVIPDFNFKVVEIVINALCGKIYDQPLQKEQYLMLYRFADKYDIEKLKTAVEESIVITPSTVVAYANYFLQYFCDQLVNCCIDYILSCSQYSVPIKDIELLDMQIRAMFFDRSIVNPVFMKGPKTENRCHNDESENYSIKTW